MTSVMSHTGEREYGNSSPEAFAHLTRGPATDRESYIEGHLGWQRIWGSPEFADEARWRADAERAFDRCFHPSGPGRQFLAVGASGSRADALRELTVPTLVMHGDRDTLIGSSRRQVPVRGLRRRCPCRCPCARRREAQRGELELQCEPELHVQGEGA